MAEWVIPVERETGIPLSFAPRFDIPSDLRVSPGEHDWHHAVYPKSRYRTLSGQALRGARVQYVDYDEHRTYHHYFDEYFANEWQAPRSRLDRFGAVVLLSAGYIPELAIRNRRHGPEYVRLSEAKRQFMWEHKLVRVEKEGKIYDFLREVVLNQPLDIDDVGVQEFVFTTDEQLRIQRGNELLASAAEQATDRIRDQYQQAYQGRLLLPTLPSNPRDCVLANPVLLGTENRQRRARTTLRVQLADTMGVELPDVA